MCPWVWIRECHNTFKKRWLEHSKLIGSQHTCMSRGVTDNFEIAKLSSLIRKSCSTNTHTASCVLFCCSDFLPLSEESYLIKSKRIPRAVLEKKPQSNKPCDACCLRKIVRWYDISSTLPKQRACECCCTRTPLLCPIVCSEFSQCSPSTACLPEEGTKFRNGKAKNIPSQPPKFVCFDFIARVVDDNGGFWLGSCSGESFCCCWQIDQTKYLLRSGECISNDQSLLL